MTTQKPPAEARAAAPPRMESDGLQEATHSMTRSAHARARSVATRAAKQVAKMEAREGEGHPVAIKPGHEPSTKVEYFVSYAWGDDTQDGREREAVVNRFCAAAAAKGRLVIRDKTAMHTPATASPNSWSGSAAATVSSSSSAISI